MLTGILKGLLILLILATLLAFPFTFWVPEEEALHYSKQLIVVLGWLWFVLAAPVLLLAHFVQQRYFSRDRS